MSLETIWMPTFPILFEGVFLHHTEVAFPRGFSKKEDTLAEVEVFVNSNIGKSRTHYLLFT